MAFTWIQSVSPGTPVVHEVVNEIVDNIETLNERIRISIPSFEDQAENSPIYNNYLDSLINTIDSLKDNNYCRAQNTSRDNSYIPTYNGAERNSTYSGADNPHNTGNYSRDSGYDGSDDGCNSHPTSNNNCRGNQTSYDHQPSVNSSMDYDN